jgi:hypothetical protein
MGQAWRMACHPKLTLRLYDSRERRMVDQTGASWNPVIRWLRQIEDLKFAG